MNQPQQERIDWASDAAKHILERMGGVNDPGDGDVFLILTSAKFAEGTPAVVNPLEQLREAVTYYDEQGNPWTCQEIEALIEKEADWGDWEYGRAEWEVRMEGPQ